MLTVAWVISPAFADNSGQSVNSSPQALQLYKGELLISVPSPQRDAVLLRYRAKNKEAVRVGISELGLINTATQDVTRLSDRSASLANQVDRDGYWFVDIEYLGLRLANDNYRVDGNFTEYLRGSQRSRAFSIYLQPEFAGKPADSTIDWGGEN